MTFSFRLLSNQSILLVGFLVRIFDIGIFGFVSFLGFGFISTLLFFCRQVGVFFIFVWWGVSYKLLDCAG